jgi:inner membrane protein
VPSSIAHAAVAVIANPVIDRADRSRGLVWVAAVAAVLPDLDTVDWVLRGGRGLLSPAHRGISHSLLVAFVAAAVITTLWHRIRLLQSPARACGYFALVIASHGMLDWLTTYGDGVALLAPFSSKRFSSSWSLFGGPISEILCLWLPALIFTRLDIGGFRRGPTATVVSSSPAG